jgi:hypothetical protein
MPSEPLPLCALNGEAGPRGIVDAGCDAVVVAEIELVQVAMQVMVAHVLVRAEQAALRIKKKPSTVLVWTLPSTCSPLLWLRRSWLGDVVDGPAIAGAVVRHEPGAALQLSLWINENVARTSVNIFN